MFDDHGFCMVWGKNVESQWLYMYVSLCLEINNDIVGEKNKQKKLILHKTCNNKTPNSDKK